MTETETHAPKFDELEIAEPEGVSGGGRGANVVKGSANRKQLSDAWGFSP
jgi:hypothetical protein